MPNYTIGFKNVSILINVGRKDTIQSETVFKCKPDDKISLNQQTQERQTTSIRNDFILEKLKNVSNLLYFEVKP